MVQQMGSLVAERRVRAIASHREGRLSKKRKGSLSEKTSTLPKLSAWGAKNADALEIFGAAEEGTFLGKNDPAERSIIPACAFGAGEEEEEEEEGEFLDCCKGKWG
jgi:hypothetical protein